MSACRWTSSGDSPIRTSLSVGLDGLPHILLIEGALYINVSLTCAAHIKADSADLNNIAPLFYGFIDSLHEYGFLSPPDSLVACGFLAPSDSLNLIGFLLPIDSLDNSGFLSTNDSLTLPGFLAIFDSLPTHGFLVFCDSLVQSGFLVYHDSLPYFGFLKPSDSLEYFGFLNLIDSAGMNMSMLFFVVLFVYFQPFDFSPRDI